MTDTQFARILSSYHHDPSNLLAILQDVQDVDRYVSPDAMTRVATDLRIPLTRVYSMATFFSAFRLDPVGRHHCAVCTGTACHVRGATRLVEEVERQFDAAPGRRSPDGEISIETVHCVGACAMGPLAVVDGEYQGHMTPQKLTATLKRLVRRGGRR